MLNKHRLLLLVVGIAVAVAACDCALGAAMVLDYAPQGADLSPARLDVLVEAGHAYVLFDNPVFPASVTSDSVYIALSGTKVPVAVTQASGISVSAYQIDLGEPLKANSTYTVNVTADVLDIDLNPVTPFTGAFTTPTVTPNGQSEPITARIDVNFGELMNVAAVVGSDKITVSGVSGTVIKGATDSQYTFVPDAYLAHSTQYTVTLQAAIGDKDNHPLVADVVCTFKTVALTVTSITPTNGEQDVDPAKTATRPTVTFSDRVDPDTVTTTSTFTISAGGVAVAGHVAVVPGSDNRSFTFTLAQDLEQSTEYTIALTNGVKDDGGGELTPFSSTFTTMGLKVISITPSATPMPVLGALQVTFSEAVDPATVTTAGSFRIQNVRTSAYVVGTVAASAGDTVFTFTPSQPMLKADQHRLTLTNAITAVSGSKLTPHAPFTFTTEPLSLQVASVNPTNVATDRPVASTVLIGFNESVAPATVYASTFPATADAGTFPDAITPGTFRVYRRVSSTWESELHGVVQRMIPKVYRFTPSAATPLVRGATYIVRVTGARDANNNPTGVTDLNGNPMKADFESTFTTLLVDGNYTLTGVVTFTDTDYDRTTGAVEAPAPTPPARSVTLRFYDAAGGVLDADVTTMTDAGGYFAHDFGAADPGLVTVKVFAEGKLGRQTVAVKRQTDDAVHFYEHTAAIDLGTTAWQSVLITDDAKPVCAAFNIYNTLADGYDTLTGALGEEPGSDFTLTVKWETGVSGEYNVVYPWLTAGQRAKPYISDGRTVFWREETGENCINVPGFIPGFLHSGFDDDMVLDAYARFLLAQFSKDDAPGDRHFLTTGNKGYGVNLDLRQAWAEGWAHFFPALVRDDSHLFYLYPDARIDLQPAAGEQMVSTPPGVNTTGPNNEFGVAAVLWDIYADLKAKSPADVQRIWTAVKGLSADTDVSLEDFWKRIVPQWLAAGLTQSAVDAIATGHSVEYYADANEAGDGNETRAAANDLALDTVLIPSVSHNTLYLAGDVDYFKFTAQQQHKYRIQADSATNGAAAAIQVEDAGGFVWAQESTVAVGTFTSTVNFTAPVSSVYYVRCRRAPNVPLPAVNNSPADSITSQAATEFGSYTLRITDQGTDTAGPVVIDWAPRNDDITIAKIFVLFDKPVHPNTATKDSIGVWAGSGQTATNIAQAVAIETPSEVSISLASPLQAGQAHSVRVTNTVTDFFGNAATAATHAFTVPSITPNADGAAITMSITVTFGEDVDPATVENTQNITVESAVGVAGTIAKGADNKTYTFTPAQSLAHSTEYTVTIKADVVKDAEGNGLIADVAGTFSTLELAVDTVVPANAATGIPVDASVTVTFNAPVDPATLNVASFLLSCAAGPVAAESITADAGSDNKSWVFLPNTRLRSSTQYTVTVTTAVKDTYGGSLAAEFTSTFTTGALQVLNVETVGYDTKANVPVTCPIKVTFNAPVDPATVTPPADVATAGSFSVQNQRTLAYVMGTIAANDTNREFTFTPDAGTPMLKADTYKVILTAAIKDAGGTALAPPTPTEFTTELLSLTVAAVDPLNGTANVAVSSTMITVTFNEGVKAETVTGNTLKVFVKLSPTREDAVPGVVAVDPVNDKTWTFTAAAQLLRGAEYVVRVIGARDAGNNPTGVTDAYGNPMVANFQSTFTTKTVDGNYTLRGFVTRYDKDYSTATGVGTETTAPARFVTLEFYATEDVLLDTRLTDVGGYYEIDFGATDPGPIAIKVLADGTALQQTLTVKEVAADEVHSYQLADPVDLAAAAKQDVNITGDVAAAFNVYDTIVAGYLGAVSLGAADNGPFALTAYWEPGQNGPLAAQWGKAVYGNVGADVIDVLDTDGFNDRVLLEAYARFLQNVYSHDGALGDRHYTTARADRGYGVRLDLRQAWSEGWAHFFSSVVANDARSVFVRNGAVTVRFDLATPVVSLPAAAQVSGPDNEFAVASLLWYIYQIDTASYGPMVWDTLANMQAPATLEEFYRVWAGKGYPVSPSTNDAAKARGILYQPDGTPATLDSPLVLTVGAAAVTRTFYPANDVDYFKFDAAQGQTVQIKTFGLSSGADTILAVTDLTGFPLTTEIPGPPDRTWADLAADPVSSIVFKAPFAGTQSYLIACSHSTANLPVVDNEPDDGIAAGCPASLGGYSLAIVTTTQGITVARVSPENAATGVAVDVNKDEPPTPGSPKVLIVFNGEVDSATVTADTFTVVDSAGDDVPGNIAQIDQAGRYFAYVFDANLLTSAVYTVGVTAGVKDTLGNPITPFTSTFGTLGPFVDTVIPAANATAIAVDTTVTIKFKAEVDDATVTTTSFKLLKETSEVAGTVAQDTADTLAFIFTPTEKLNTSVVYTVHVAGVKDKAGVTMENAFESTFTTGKLAVVSWSPADTATAVAVSLPDSGISITFNSDLDPATAFDPATMISSTVIVTRDTSVVVGSYVQATDPHTLVVRPAAYLRDSKAYTVTVKGGDAGVKSVDGDTLAADVSISFTAAARPATQLHEKVAKVTRAKAYSGSGSIDIAWTNPFGDWPGLLIAGGGDVFPSISIGADKDGKAELQVKNGNVIYQGDMTKTSYRIKMNDSNPLHINIWVVNGLDYSKAVSLESRSVQGAKGMPGKLDEPTPTTTNNNNNPQTLAAKAALAFGNPPNGNTAPAENNTDGGTTPPVVAPEPAAEPPAGLSDPVIGSVRGPMQAKAAAGDGYVDVKWAVPSGVDGIIVAASSAGFPTLKTARDSDGNVSFWVVGGAKVYEGGDSKRVRINTPNGGIRRFTLWTYAGGKISRPVSLESRATAGARGM